MIRRITFWIWTLLVLNTLVACGNVSTPAGALPTATAAGGPPATAMPATAMSNPTAQSTPAAAITSIAAQPPAATAELAIPEGLTPEGYHELGRADAPVTLVMYSDFL
jgi:hypothetical protein